MNPYFCFAISIIIIASAIASPPQAINPEKIKDKISITPGKTIAIVFKRDRDQLLQPSKSKAGDSEKAVVKIKLDETSASPVSPPRKGATRPFLEVENSFEKPLHFRLLVRMKNSKEFFELGEPMKPVPAGETFTKCWEFDTPIEEVVLYQFKLTDPSPE